MLGRFESSDLNEIQRNSSIEAGRDLFDSIVVFENYPSVIGDEDSLLSVGSLPGKSQFLPETVAPWGILLSRYCNCSDVLYGATVSGRNCDLPGIDSMSGLFINTLPVRLDVQDEWSAES